MANVLLAEQEYAFGDDLKWLLEDRGYSVTWYQHRDKVRELYDNVPEYDIAIVDRCINGSPADENSQGIDCDDLVKRLKQVNPNKKVFCLTHGLDLCELADENITGMSQADFDGLFAKVELATKKQ